MTIDVTPKQPIAPDHLGDGVYASHDGWMIGLSVNDHRNRPVVYLEPGVMEALIRYYERTKASA